MLSPHRLADRARAWAEAHAPGPIAEITGVGAGITNTKWRLRLADGESLVVRWSDPEIWGATGQDHVRREAMACELLASSTVPVPRLIATDLDGATAGGPASLMGWQQGRTRHDLLGPAAVTALAELTVAVHRTPVPAELRPPEFSYRGPAIPEVPSWARRPELWRRAIEFRQAGAPATPYGLLHRDFHLGNLLWQADAITGLIDWTDASWGPPDLDVAHLCSDLAMLHTLDDVLSFRAAYTAAGGHLDPDPDAARFWIVADILGFLPDPAHVLPAYAANRPDVTADQVRFGLEDLLGLALTGSGRSFPGR